MRISGKLAVALLALVMVLVFVGVGIILATPNTETDAQASCTPAGLTKSWSGTFHVQSVQSYGCEGKWAYVWATIGDTQHSVSVTELEHFEPLGWLLVNRQTYCPTAFLPAKIRKLACNSN
jgi:hypothetical protein